jgi:CHAT domain-containing protein
LGDPRYGSAPRSAGAVSDDEVVRRVQGLAPLPGTRLEVEAVATLFGERAVVHLGPDATEGQVKALGRGPRYVHLAAHGLVDRRFPLDSAIALSPSAAAEDNGLLQAWEVLEQLRIDADLVTLSACETGLGKNMAGEGLVGLTRAFQYAGARSVLASLWSVSDRRTAQLMSTFYRELAAGHPKDEALRAAQLALLRGEEAPGRQTTGDEDDGADVERGVGKLTKGRPPGDISPFYWAAFQLYGDWR